MSKLDEEREKAREVLRISHENDRFPSLGDLVLRSLSPLDPRYHGGLESEVMHITALELKCVLVAMATVRATKDFQPGEYEDSPTDDTLTSRDIETVISAIASRLDASAELCRRLTEARWNQEGFPGRVDPSEVQQ